MGLINRELEDKISKAIESLGAKLYDIEILKEYQRSIFRISITSKDGVSLELCESVSRLLSPLLDIEQPVNENYFFEVSSPGVERILQSERHFLNSIGELVSIKKIDKEKIKGVLKDFKDGKLFLERDKESLEINLDEIKRVKTIFEW